MNRIIKLPKADIVFDYRSSSDIVMEACARSTPLKVAGFCETEKILILSLEDNTMPEKYEYVFAKFPSENEDDIIGEIRSRFFAGFSTLGSFHLNNETWGLFSKTGPTPS